MNTRKIFAKVALMVAAMLFVFTAGMQAAEETYTYTTGDGTWVTNDIERQYQSTNFTFLHKKNNSSSNVATTYAELRVYASHSMEVFPTIPGKTITSVVVTAGSAAYATAMGNATILAGVSSSNTAPVSNIATVDGSTVTFDLTGVVGCEYVKFTLAAQSRTLSWKIVYTEASGTPVVASPLFAPGTGNYLEAQEVTLTSATAGASIYYTVDGSTPDNTKTLYTAPFSVSATTTVKAIAYKTGMDASAVSSATYTFPTEVANLAALRAGGPGIYKLTGEVVLTLQSTTRNVKYIQDATGAVVIDDASGVITTTYNLGDGITGLIGTTSVYNGTLQFIPAVNPAAASSTGNVIQPVEVTLENLADYQAKLVKVNGVTISDLASGGNGTFILAKSYDLNGANNPVLRTQYALDYIGAELPATAQDIVGVVLMFNSTVQLVPRSLADIKPSVGTGLDKVSDQRIFAAGDQIFVDATAGEVIEVFTVTGQKLTSVTAADGLNTVHSSSKGVLIVKVADRVAKVML
ncbi:MAG: hypothetical protein BGP01_04795 [Paludibacter sp. 47-17]|nr:MAG: hypothetical protein BGP01_04795 [Paludibacter sp. 47-17]